MLIYRIYLNQWKLEIISGDDYFLIHWLRMVKRQNGPTKELIFENLRTIFSSIFFFPVVKIETILKSVFIQPDIILFTLKMR